MTFARLRASRRLLGVLALVCRSGRAGSSTLLRRFGRSGITEEDPAPGRQCIRCNHSPDAPTEQETSGAARSPGFWHEQDLQRFTAMVESVPGDFGEVGVWRGDASRKLIRLSALQNKRTHLFDSFRGMDEPGRFDSGAHPKGEFDVGGLPGFQAMMRSHGLSDVDYSAHEGFIPACFADVPSDRRFSLVILDVDNYDPTRDALRWVWPLMNKGGVLALDDFYPTGNVDATKAIKEFLREQNDYCFLDFFNYQLFLMKVNRTDMAITATQPVFARSDARSAAA